MQMDAQWLGSIPMEPLDFILQNEWIVFCEITLQHKFTNQQVVILPIDSKMHFAVMRWMIGGIVMTIWYSMPTCIVRWYFLGGHVSASIIRGLGKKCPTLGGEK